ncbi:MAG: hypothetical protein M5U28_28010 [Sandaracinaceae bacterium]|nr:hypothetical protein [Sandaracinaceae bacterium]
MKLASAIRSACVIADAISVLVEQPVKLRAARRLPVLYRQGSPGEASGDAAEPDRTVMTFIPMEEAAETTSSVLTDDWIRGGLSAFLYALRSVSDSNVRRTLEVALSWHAQANRIGGLGQYAQYWASIELLASFFYEYCKPEFIGRKSNDAIRAEVLARLNDMASKELNETIRDCGELLRPTAQTKVRALLSVIFPKPQKEDRRDKIRGLLFAKENGPDGKPIRNSKSLYDIRNDVAHGNISALDRDYYDQHAERLHQFRSVSQAFILGVSRIRACSRRQSTGHELTFKAVAPRSAKRGPSPDFTRAARSPEPQSRARAPSMRARRDGRAQLPRDRRHGLREAPRARHAGHRARGQPRASARPARARTPTPPRARHRRVRRRPSTGATRSGLGERERGFAGSPRTILCRWTFMHGASQPHLSRTSKSSTPRR